MLLGLRAQESLLTTVRAEQINCLHPWELPIASIQHNAADQQLLLAGKLEINPELFDDDVQLSMFIVLGLLSWLENLS